MVNDKIKVCNQDFAGGGLENNKNETSFWWHIFGIVTLIISMSSNLIFLKL